MRGPAFLLTGFEGGQGVPLPPPITLLPNSTPVGKGHPVVTLKYQNALFLDFFPKLTGKSGFLSNFLVPVEYGLNPAKIVILVHVMICEYFLGHE